MVCCVVFFKRETAYEVRISEWSSDVCSSYLHLEAKVGGTYKMSFRNFGTGRGHSFGGKYVELVPIEKIRYTAQFDDPNLPGQIHVTVSLRSEERRVGNECVSTGRFRCPLNHKKTKQGKVHTRTIIV